MLKEQNIGISEYVENARENLENVLNVLDVEVRNGEKFIMKERKEVSKTKLVDLFCKKCEKTTPHVLEKRETCDGGEGIVGICIFCSSTAFLEKRIRLKEIGKES